LLNSPDLFVLIGYPLYSSLSPTIYNYSFDYYNLDNVYIKFPINPEYLSKLDISFFKNLNFKGGNITIPFKERMINYIDVLSEKAIKTSAINTFYKKDNLLYGDNTDVYGFSKSLENYKKYLNSDILVLGTGGSAKAIVTALNDLNIKNIYIASREYDKAKVFVENRNLVFPNINLYPITYSDIENINLDKFSMIVNSTPVGMYDNESILDEKIVKRIEKYTLVYDIIYNKKTKLLELSEKNNLITLNGLYMLIYQCESAFKLWTGKDLPVSKIREIFSI